MQTTFIYGLFDPISNELRYIGKADNPKNRLLKHIGEARRGVPNHKNNWIRSILKVGLLPCISILEEVPIENWKEYEVAWIAKFRTSGAELVNGTNGGDAGGVKRGNHTEEHKRKISESGKRRWEQRKALGYKMSDEARMKMSIAAKNRTDERREAVRQQMKGNKIHLGHKSPAVSEKMKSNKNMLGHTHSKETKQKMRESALSRVNDEFRREISERMKGKTSSFLGRKHTDETKRRISESEKRTKAKKKSVINET